MNLSELILKIQFTNLLEFVKIDCTFYDIFYHQRCLNLDIISYHNIFRLKIDFKLIRILL